MKRAILNLIKKPDLVLVMEYLRLILFINVRAIIKGDEKIKCISAASILAKVYRDEIMIKLSKNLRTILGTKIMGTELNNTLWD